MALPDRTTLRSIAGAATPTYLTSTLSGGYSNPQTFTLATTSGWYEVSSSGKLTTNPLGTSGPFTLKVDYGTATEETILCSGAITPGASSTITVYYDGSSNGRGYDGTPIQAHSAGSSSNYNVFPVQSATADLQVNQTVAFSAITSGTNTFTASQIINGNLTISGGLTVSGTTILNGTNTIYGTVELGTTILNSGTYTNASISGGTFTNNQVTVNSGNIVLLSGSLALVSGNLVTTNSNLAALSGSLALVSGNLVTTNSNLATLSGSVSSISGSLSTVSGVAYSALPKTGGTISGNLTITGALAVNSTNIALGANTPISSANVGGVAVGNYAGQTSNNGGVAVGAYAGSTQNFDGVAVGYEAGYYYNEFGVAIGYLANINNTGSNYTTAIGYQVNATAPGSVAIGTDHTGAGATSSTQDQIVLGTSNHIVNIPGKLTVSGSNVLVSGTTANGDLTGTYPNPSISTTLSGVIYTSQNNLTALSGSVSSISGTLSTTVSNVTSLSGSLSLVSGNLVTTNSNLAALSGSVSSISGSLSTTVTNVSTISGVAYQNQANIATQSGYLSTVSGVAGTALNNVATQSGYVSTLSGYTYGSLTTTAFAASGMAYTISGQLTTVSGLLKNYLPLTGGTVGPLTVSGSLTVSGTTTLSGGVTIYGATTINNTLTISGITITGGTTTSGYVLTATSTSGASFQPASSGTLLTSTVRSGNSTATAGEYTLVSGSSSVTITLPTSPTNGTINTILFQNTGNNFVSRGGTNTITSYQGTTQTTGITSLGSTGLIHGSPIQFTYLNGVWYLGGFQNTSGGGSVVMTSGATFDSSSQIQAPGGIYVNNGYSYPITINDGAGTGGSLNVTYNAADSLTHSLYLPALTADDTVVGQAFKQTLTNKTIVSGILSGETKVNGNLTISGGNLTVSGITITGGTTTSGYVLTATSTSGASFAAPITSNYLQVSLGAITTNTVLVSGVLSPGTWQINYKALMTCTIQPTLFIAASGAGSTFLTSTIAYSSSVVAGGYQAQGFYILVVSGTGAQLNLSTYAYNGSNVTVSGLINFSGNSVSAGNQTGFTAVRIV